MTKRVLPIKTLYLTSYQHHTLLSITSCYDETLPWFFSNYIQLRFNKVIHSYSEDYFNFYDYDFTVHRWPWLEEQKIGRDILSLFDTDIVSFIEECIKKEYYVYTYADEYFIPKRLSYLKKHNTHDLLLYGYDEIEETLNVLGFDEISKLRETKVNFSDFRSAFTQARIKDDWEKYLFLFRFKKDARYNFDIHLVVDLLEDYLHGRDTSRRNAMFRNPMNAVFGMNIYREFKAHVLALCSGKRELFDIRPYHVLWEHKKCMVLRIEYLIHEGFLERGCPILLDFKEIERECLALRNVCIKYNITYNPILTQRIIRRLDFIYEKEYAAVQQLVKLLKEHTIPNG